MSRVLEFETDSRRWFPLWSRDEADKHWTAAIARRYPQTLFSPRYDPVFSDGLSRRWLKANWSAFRETRFGRMTTDHCQFVCVKAFSRGGSHAFCSQMHLVPSVFTFFEQHDPKFVWTSDWRTRAFLFRSFLIRGIFGPNSLQNKRISGLRTLVFNENASTTKFHGFWERKPSKRLPERRWILYLRNPFRVLHSMSATGKEKWRLTPDNASGFLRLVMDYRDRFRNLKARFPGSVGLLLHERYCLEPDHVLANVGCWLGISETDTRPSAQAFYRRFLRCGSIPVEQDGWLTSPVTGERLMGPGAFNPIQPIVFARTVSGNVADQIPADIIAEARHILGLQLTSYWLEDHIHAYREGNASGLEDLMLPGT